MLAFELAAYPLSMSNADWRKMNVATSKSTLKYKLQSTVSEHNCRISDTMIIMCLHFCGLSPGRLANCVSSAFVHQAIRRANISFVFDRYFPNSTMTFTRTQRSGSSRVYTLTPYSQALANQVILTNTKNRNQLNAMLSESILDPSYFTESTQKHQTHTIAIAGVSDVPVQITGLIVVAP